MKLTREKKTKPLFWEFVLFDPKAFKVVFYMSLGMGLLINISLFASSLIFGWMTEIQVITGIVLIANLYNFIKFIRGGQYINTSINDMVFNKKYKGAKHGNNR